ncbi:MAG: hypothetical protein WEB58_21870 [Planctomycetaceae bacterium]
MPIRHDKKRRVLAKRWHPADKKYPRVQLLTVEGLLSGHQRAEHPDHVKNLNFKQAKRETKKTKKGKTLFDAMEE